MSETAYYDALKRITNYLPLSKLRRDAEKQYGLDYEEALEMAYENVLEEAKSVLRGKRRPAEGSKPVAPKRRPMPAISKLDIALVGGDLSD